MKTILPLLALLWGLDAEGSAQRPNILFAFADDWGRHASAHARLDGPGTVNDLIQTPAFDRVAREGVLFRRAFVSAPSCTPCRSALVSGQHFWRTGRASILRGAVWDGSSPAFPLLLRDSGYHLGKMYKVWSPGTPSDAPYGGQQHAYEMAGGRFNQFSQNYESVYGRRAGAELYDLISDPHQPKNVASDPAYAAAPPSSKSIGLEAPSPKTPKESS